MRALPLYPYRCTQCGHRFEKIQHFNAKPEKVCPKCGGALERVLTAPGLQFKGAGWYVNDYAAKSSSSTDGGQGVAAAAEKTPAEKKPAKETKAAAAPEGASSSASPAAATPAAKSTTPKD